jgi:ankyrin repeat protein
VRELLAEGADVDAGASDGSTALLWATYYADLEMVRLLVERGSAVDRANEFGITPLLQASRTGDTAVIEALLAAGADVSQASPLGETPLMAVARTGNTQAARLLLDRGAELNARDARQQTALMRAAAEGHTPLVDLLLSAGANPNAQAAESSLTIRFNADFPSGGFTALMWAARNNHRDVVRRLLDAGADPNLTNGDGATAMTIAIVNDCFDVAAMLLDAGADANDGSLYHAVEMHDATTDMYALDGTRLRADRPNRTTALDLIKRLLERGADPDKPVVRQLHSTTLCCGEFTNGSAFYRAAAAADVEALRLMIAHGADLEWTPSRVDQPGADGSIGTPVGANQSVGLPAIHVVMDGGRGAFIANGPGVHGREGPPPFREASNREPAQALALLLESGANTDSTGPDGSTALHKAAQDGRPEMVRLLANAGASLAVRNKDGFTPLELAEELEKRSAEGTQAARTAYRESIEPDHAARVATTRLLRELAGVANAVSAAAGRSAMGARGQQ